MILQCKSPRGTVFGVQLPNDWKRHSPTILFGTFDMFACVKLGAMAVGVTLIENPAFDPLIGFIRLTENNVEHTEWAAYCAPWLDPVDYVDLPEIMLSFYSGDTLYRQPVQPSCPPEISYAMDDETLLRKHYAKSRAFATPIGKGVSSPHA